MFRRIPAKTQDMKVDLRADRALVPTGEATQRYVEIAITAPTLATDLERPALNLSLVLDRSGSMAGDKLRHVQQAAKHALTRLTARDLVSIVTYDHNVSVVAEARPVTDGARRELNRLIDRIRVGGRTNLSGGWLTGCDQIAAFQEQRPNDISRALLLTDGLANEGVTDQEELAYRADQLRQRGISTTTLGVGHDFNEFLLQAMADAGGGHFYFIENPRQIPNYFKGELGELAETTAREAVLTLKLPAGFEASLINDVRHEQEAGALRVFLDDLYSGDQRRLYFELNLPAGELGTTFASEANVAYDDVASGESRQTTAEPLTFTVAEAAACDTQPVDEEVQAEAARTRAEKAKLEALKLDREGRREEAQQALRAAVKFTAAMAPGAAPMMSQELTAMEKRLADGMDEAERKATQYAAYRQQRSRRDYKDKEE
jgi:Ca-activated chloride channel family protein